MDFPKAVRDAGPNVEPGLTWWSTLCDEAAAGGTGCSSHHLRHNVAESQLFELNGSYLNHVSDFCVALAGRPEPEAVQRATAAIEQTRRMICAGPPGGDMGTACALITFRSFLKRYLAGGIRGTVGSPADPSFEQLVWDDLEDPEYYDDVVDKRKEYRGELPNRFWTAHEDIEALENRGVVSALRLRQFLGIDMQAQRTLLIRVDENTNPLFTVPTGWDGFTSPNFRENVAYKAAEPHTHFGYTIDVSEASAPCEGARELVCEPVAAGNTRLIRKYA